MGGCRTGRRAQPVVRLHGGHRLRHRQPGHRGVHPGRRHEQRLHVADLDGRRHRGAEVPPAPAGQRGLRAARQRPDHEHHLGPAARGHAPPLDRGRRQHHHDPARRRADRPAHRRHLRAGLRRLPPGLRRRHRRRGRRRQGREGHRVRRHGPARHRLQHRQPVRRRHPHCAGAAGRPAPRRALALARRQHADAAHRLRHRRRQDRRERPGVRHRARHLRADPQRGEGRRPAPRSGLDRLPRPLPEPDLRRHRPRRRRAERLRCRARQRLVGRSHRPPRAPASTATRPRCSPACGSSTPTAPRSGWTPTTRPGPRRRRLHPGRPDRRGVVRRPPGEGRLERARLRRRGMDPRCLPHGAGRPGRAAARRAGAHHRGAHAPIARTEPAPGRWTSTTSARTWSAWPGWSSPARPVRPSRSATARSSTPTGPSTPPTCARPRSPTATPSPRPAPSPTRRASPSTASATSRSSAAPRRRRAADVTGVVWGSDLDAHRRPRDLRPDAQPARQQHLVGPARQLPLDPDRHPGARRAPRLDRRHQRLRRRRRPTSPTPARSCPSG